MKQTEIFRRSSDNHKQPQKLVLNLEEARGPSSMSRARTARCQNSVSDLSRSQTNCHSGEQGSLTAQEKAVWKQDKGQSWNNGNKPTPSEKMSRTKMHLKIVRSVRR